MKSGLVEQREGNFTSPSLELLEFLLRSRGWEIQSNEGGVLLGAWPSGLGPVAFVTDAAADTGEVDFVVDVLDDTHGPVRAASGAVGFSYAQIVARAAGVAGPMRVYTRLGRDLVIDVRLIEKIIASAKKLAPPLPGKDGLKLTATVLLSVEKTPRMAAPDQVLTELDQRSLIVMGRAKSAPINALLTRQYLWLTHYLPLLEKLADDNAAFAIPLWIEGDEMRARGIEGAVWSGWWNLTGLGYASDMTAKLVAAGLARLVIPDLDRLRTGVELDPNTAFFGDLLSLCGARGRFVGSVSCGDVLFDLDHPLPDPGAAAEQDWQFVQLKSLGQRALLDEGFALVEISAADTFQYQAEKALQTWEQESKDRVQGYRDAVVAFCAGRVSPFEAWEILEDLAFLAEGRPGGLLTPADLRAQILAIVQGQRRRPEHVAVIESSLSATEFLTQLGARGFSLRDRSMAAFLVSSRIARLYRAYAATMGTASAGKYGKELIDNLSRSPLSNEAIAACARMIVSIVQESEARTALRQLAAVVGVTTASEEAPRLAQENYLRLMLAVLEAAESAGPQAHAAWVETMPTKSLQMRSLALPQTKWRGLDLSEAKFVDCNLGRAVMVGCDLSATSFRDSDLGGSVFVSVMFDSGMNFANARMSGAWMKNVTGLRNALVMNSYRKNGNLRGSSWIGALVVDKMSERNFLTELSQWGAQVSGFRVERKDDVERSDADEEAERLPIAHLLNAKDVNRAGPFELSPDGVVQLKASGRGEPHRISRGGAPARRFSYDPASQLLMIAHEGGLLLALRVVLRDGLSPISSEVFRFSTAVRDPEILTFLPNSGGQIILAGFTGNRETAGAPGGASRIAFLFSKSGALSAVFPWWPDGLRAPHESEIADLAVADARPSMLVAAFEASPPNVVARPLGEPSFDVRLTRHAGERRDPLDDLPDIVLDQHGRSWFREISVQLPQQGLKVSEYSPISYFFERDLEPVTSRRELRLKVPAVFWPSQVAVKMVVNVNYLGPDADGRSPSPPVVNVTVARRQNPFDASGRPARGEREFFGRRGFVKECQAAIAANAYLIIRGARRFGKTSVLAKLAEDARAEGRLALDVSLIGLREVVPEFGELVRRRLRETFPNQAGSAIAGMIPDSRTGGVGSVLAALVKAAREHVFAGRPLLILDEWGVASNRQSEYYSHDFVKAVTEYAYGGNGPDTVQFCLSGAPADFLNEGLDAQSDAYRGGFQWFDLKPLTHDEIVSLLDGPLRALNIQPATGERQQIEAFLTAHASGDPLAARLIMAEAYEAFLNEGKEGVLRLRHVDTRPVRTKLEQLYSIHRSYTVQRLSAEEAKALKSGLLAPDADWDSEKAPGIPANAKNDPMGLHHFELAGFRRVREMNRVLAAGEARVWIPWGMRQDILTFLRGDT
jgi:hypothetical protein